jgi:predicted O-methyltransferase YrrM
MKVYNPPASWAEYFEGIQPRLNKRSDGFQKIFEYLADKKNPIIVETGTYREEDNYEGDGCSTLLFDAFVDYHGGSVLSVDIDPEACKLAIENTCFTEVIESDSVEYLGSLEGKVDLLYLDSYNLPDKNNLTYWHEDWESAAHCLKELFAAKNCIKDGTLIVVDDNAISPKGCRRGKGRLIYELMESLGIEPYFDSYQVGWIWQETV